MGTFSRGGGKLPFQEEFERGGCSELASFARRIMSEGAKNSSSFPGFVDLHLHGAFGVDVLTASPADMDRLASGLAARGVAPCVPPLAPQPCDAMAGTVPRLSVCMKPRRSRDVDGPRPRGMHFA